MASRKHRQYLEQARQRGHTPDQAEEALRRVRENTDSQGYVADLYERALTVLDAGPSTHRQRTDADRILADYGITGAPAEMRQVMGHVLGQMGLTVDEQGRPAPAGEAERFADAVDGLPGAEGLAREVPAPTPSGPPTSVHHTTFVLPKSRGLEYNTPVLVLAAEEAQDVARLPLPTSLHRIGNQVMGYSRARPMEELGQITVSDAWIQAVIEYEGDAKIVVVQEPLPRGQGTEDTDPTTGVPGTGLPFWAEDLLQQRISAALRDVSVSDGTNPLSIHIMPSAPIRLPAWAHQTFPPSS